MTAKDFGLTPLVPNAFDSAIIRAFPYPLELNLSNSLETTWFVGPTQHLLQFFFVIAFSSAILCAEAAFDPRQPSSYHHARPSTPLRRAASWISVGMLAALYALIVEHKTRQGLLYLLQPCHVSHVLIVVWLALDNSARLKRWLSDCVVCSCVWAVGIALPFADWRDYHSAFDIGVFLTQHISLIIIPLVVAFTSGAPMRRPSFWHILAQWSWHALFHWCVLLPTAVLTGSNLNYMMAPPYNPVLLNSGRAYHFVQSFGTILITFATRLVIVEPIAFIGRWLLPPSCSRRLSRAARSTPRASPAGSPALPDATPKAGKAATPVKAASPGGEAGGVAGGSATKRRPKREE